MRVPVEIQSVLLMSGAARHHFSPSVFFRPVFCSSGGRAFRLERSNSAEVPAVMPRFAAVAGAV
jgi:hypothetical protein